MLGAAAVLSMLGPAAPLGAQESRPNGPLALGEKLDDFVLKDSDGRERHLTDQSEKKAIVLAFFGAGCPINKIYAPRYRAIAARYADRNVAFLLVNSNDQDGIEEIRRFRRDHDLALPALKDKEHALADRLGAERTTEIFVLDGDFRLRYKGRLDDQYSLSEHAAGAYKALPERNYLTDALDAILAGKPPAIAKTEAPGCLLGRADRNAARAAAPNADTPVFHGRVDRIIQKHCQSCHRPGEIAPFSLGDYDAVAGWADMIEEVVENGRMPPWNADPSIGAFANDRRLPADEKEALLSWIRGGTPEGDRAKATPPPTFAAGWRIGVPELVIEMPEPFAVPAEGIVDLQYFTVPVPLGEDRFVQAVEIRPGAREVVHHAAVFNVKTDDVGSILENEKMQSGRNGYWALMAPGEEPTIYPKGMAKRLRGDSVMVISMHYTAIGKPVADRTRVGIVFAKEPPAREVKTATAVAEELLVIEAGDPDKIVMSSWEAEKDIVIVDLLPHMHMRGKSFTYAAYYPNTVGVSEAPDLTKLVPFIRLRTSYDAAAKTLRFQGEVGPHEEAALKGLFSRPADLAAIEALKAKGRTEVLLHVPRFDFRWQHTYRLAEPKPIPEGTLIGCTAHFDNSRANRLLTAELAAKRVRWGSQIWDEMMLGCFNYYER